MDYECNKVVLEGIISEPIVPDHVINGEIFYKTVVCVPRISDAVDSIPVIISEKILEDETYDSFVRITGSFRSYNYYHDGNRHLRLYVFAETFNIVNCESVEYKNEIFLHGTLCKNPIYRKTKFGRKISDILIGVNRQYNHSDYIPCVCWGRNAIYISRKNAGTKINIFGRIQSRVYEKRIADAETIKRTAYEISVSKMEVVDENSNT